MSTFQLARLVLGNGTTSAKAPIILLLILLMLSVFPLSTMALVEPQGEAYITPLTNGDVLGMSKVKFGDEVIVAKINSSRCHFDTVPSMLNELKHNGVSD